MPTQKDPTTFGYQNFYSTTLTGDITSGTLTIGLATVPTPTSGILIIEPDSTSSREVIFYTSKGASTITCPSDGRGWSGTSATSHLTGSTVIMASVDEYFEGLADGTLSTDPFRSQTIANHVVSGGVVAQSSGLIGTFSNIVFYLNGQRYSGSSIANKTYTASKDTYVDITATSGGTVSVTYTEVANGATAPALSANYLRIAKVVTNGSAITSVTQNPSTDGIGNTFRNIGPFSTANFSMPVRFRGYKASGSQAVTGGVATKITFTTEEYDAGANYDASNSRFTAPISGVYFLNTIVQTLAGTTTTDNNLALYKNGSLMRKGGNLKSGVYPQHQVIGMFPLAAGDYIEVYFINGVGGDTIEASATSNTFEGCLLAAD